MSGDIDAVAGYSSPGYSGDNGLATAAGPYDVAVDATGNIYIADTLNQRIRTVTPLRAAPTITWEMPAAITYGTALSATQFNATTSVPSAFVYTPAAGTVLTAGTQTLYLTLLIFAAMSTACALANDWQHIRHYYAQPDRCSYLSRRYGFSFDKTYPISDEERAPEQVERVWESRGFTSQRTFAKNKWSLHAEKG